VLDEQQITANASSSFDHGLAICCIKQRATIGKRNDKVLPQPAGPTKRQSYSLNTIGSAYIWKGVGASYFKFPMTKEQNAVGKPIL